MTLAFVGYSSIARQLLAKQKDDLVIGIVCVPNRGAPQVKMDTRGQEGLHVLPLCSHDVASVLKRSLEGCRQSSGRMFCRPML